MAWQDEMTTMVRYIINDTDTDSPTYSDSRIQTSIVVAGQLVNNEIDFIQTYTIGVTGVAIAPDPTTPTRDDAFLNIVSLRTGCIILGSEMKTEGYNAVSVSDGPSSINMTGRIAGLKVLQADVCQKYEEAKTQYKLDGNVGHAIFSPYAPGTNVVNGVGNYNNRGYFE
jgi:hypothetical protein